MLQVRGIKAYGNCLVSIFLLRPWYINISESLVFIYVLVLQKLTCEDSFYKLENRLFYE